ncbi:MAG TPA: HAD-IC family P-type ATPase, partial [Gaiellaceae bacterium]|nr:HAD-IC family P-type ATPase [Gaiellaceae bacterium]
MPPGRGEVGVARPWALGPEEALRDLASGARGLGEAEAARRLAEHGPNELPEGRGTSALALVLRQFSSPLIFILLAAALVTIALRELVDAGVIGAVLVLNAILGFTQEYRAERSMEALRRLGRATARVVRDGRERELDAAELVPGDVVLVEAGARVPADCRLLHAVSLETDESLLTGESTTVAKSAAPGAAEAPLAERTSMIFTGTVATRGHGRAVVVATGSGTELGRIATSLGEIEET